MLKREALCLITHFIKQDFHVIVFQPKPQFQSSSKGGHLTSASASSIGQPASEPDDRPFSYAEYVVQSKANVAAPPQREGPSRLLGTEVTNRRQSESASVSSAPVGCDTVRDCAEGTEGGSEGVGKSDETQVAGTDQNKGNCQRPDPSLAPKPVGSGSSIIVSPRQVCIKMFMAVSHITR